MSTRSDAAYCYREEVKVALRVYRFTLYHHWMRSDKSFTSKHTKYQFWSAWNVLKQDLREAGRKLDMVEVGNGS